MQSGEAHQWTSPIEFELDDFISAVASRSLEFALFRSLALGEIISSYCAGRRGGLTVVDLEKTATTRDLLPSTRVGSSVEEMDVTDREVVSY